MRMLHIGVYNLIALLIMDGLQKLLLCVSSCVGVHAHAIECVHKHTHRQTHRLPATQGVYLRARVTSESHHQQMDHTVRTLRRALLSLSFIRCFSNHTHIHTHSLFLTWMCTQVALNRKISIHPRASWQIHPICLLYKQCIRSEILRPSSLCCFQSYLNDCLSICHLFVLLHFALFPPFDQKRSGKTNIFVLTKCTAYDQHRTFYLKPY